MEKNIPHNKIPAWLVLLAVLASVTAMAFPLLYLVSAALWASILIRCNHAALLLLLLLPPVGVVFALYTASGGTVDALVGNLCMALLGTVPGLALCLMQAQKRGGFYSAAVTGGLSALLLYFAVCLPGVLTGEGAFAPAEAAMHASADWMRQILDQMRTPETAAVFARYEEGLSFMENAVQTWLVPMLVLLGGLLGLSNTLFFRLFVKKDREALGLTPLKPFSRWSVPREASLGMFLLLLGAVVLMLTGSNSADAVSATVAAIVGLPLFVQGIALIDYLLTRNGKNIAMKRILAYVLIAALLPSLASALLFAGCAEQVLHIRDSYDRLKQYRDTQQNGGGHA